MPRPSLPDLGQCRVYVPDTTAPEYDIECGQKAVAIVTANLSRSDTAAVPVCRKHKAMLNRRYAAMRAESKVNG